MPVEFAFEWFHLFIYLAEQIACLFGYKLHIMLNWTYSDAYVVDSKLQPGWFM